MDEALGLLSPQSHRARLLKPVRFEDVDKNGDGVIDRREYEMFRQAQKATAVLPSPPAALLQQPQFREGYSMASSSPPPA